MLVDQLCRVRSSTSYGRLAVVACHLSLCYWQIANNSLATQTRAVYLQSENEEPIREFTASQCLCSRVNALSLFCVDK